MKNQKIENLEKTHGRLWEKLTDVEVKLMRIDGTLSLRNEENAFSHKLNSKKERLMLKRASLLQDLETIKEALEDED